MEVKDFGKVGVLMGGPSSEREISLKSGKAVLAALSESSVNAVGIDIITDNEQENIKLLKSYDLDCVFIALHGRFGEDGTIQAILEKMNLPFTGSGVQASRLAMDKIGSLEIFKKQGFYTPKFLSLERSTYKKSNDFKNELGLPLVIKPANHGSSIGLSIVESVIDIALAIDLAFQFDARVILQEYIKGRELTVGVLDEIALPVIEIIPQNKFFDFQAKYQAGLTEYIVPAHLDDHISESAQKAALIAHKSLGCFGCSRTDIILSQDNLPYLLEINTIPGMISTSLLPKAAKTVSIGFDQLCLKLLELAYEKAEI
ncbi:MAG: D-alanine--D-alanine ligase [Candidatus Omnitrophica bacterium]|nr:D-alanine--D-alanine ligase [Candidatus Omnitrophota bacterium]